MKSKNDFTHGILTSKTDVDYFLSTEKRNRKQYNKKLLPKHDFLHDGSMSLEKSPKAWNRNRIKTREDILKSKLTGMMNKLTVEKMNRLTELITKFIKSEIKTKGELRMIVSLMFDKIIKESNFGTLYANLCSNISRIKIASFIDEENDTFIRILIDQCQTEFERGFKNVKVNSLEDLKVKKVALGTIQFIGQLYKKGLLPNKICKICLTNLIQNNPIDLQIECAYRFLLIIGKKYDRTKFGKKHLNKVFDIFFNLKQNRKYEMRTKILIDICISIRKNNWELLKKEEAKTIEEIHKDFQSTNKLTKVIRQGTFKNFLSRCEKINKFSIKGGIGINYSYCKFSWKKIKSHI